jgi:hypothetical protein
MLNLKGRLEEFRKTFESGAPPYNVTPEKVATIASCHGRAQGIRN